jgi:uncharacterized 2Fe-2S/4Fe-4S cluster protein (DUF4445 family)
MTVMLPQWLQRRPLIETIRMELPPPHLNDNTGDMDRLLRALKQIGFDPVRYAPRHLLDFVRRIRESGFRVTVVLGYGLDHWELLEVLPEGDALPTLGLAIDLGTTRLAFYLIDFQRHEIIEETSVANPQIPHGEDILTRILFAREEANRERLQNLLLESFNGAIQELPARHGFTSTDVYAIAVAGNTTMSHFLLGLDATNICREPYIPAANHFPLFRGEDLRLAIHPSGLVYVFPNVGSYFGGDLIAGILASGLHRSDDPSILVDVGTNAEVVVGNRDWLIACAGAAGPALEGGVVERGMIAAPGAIDRVRIDPETFEPSFRVLADEKPRGICGSGLIDLMAEMFMAGLLTIQGKINTRIDSARIVSGPDGAGFILAHGHETADGEDLTISDIDVGIFLKSKAAMYTILTVITRKVGLAFEDLKHFYVAGTFGNTIDPAMAIRIGMIPDLPIETYKGLGNTAGLGASMLLMDRSLMEDIDRVCGQITYIELNVNMELMNEFRGATFLPHTNPRLFPSVKIPERAMGR